MTTVLKNKSHSDKATSRESTRQLLSVIASTWPLRVALIGLGLLLAAIGYIGIFLPGIPTVVPLFGSAVLLTKSCPALERRLLRNRLVASSQQRMVAAAYKSPLRFRAYAIASMWASILLSCCLLHYTTERSNVLVAALLALGLLGTISIIVFRLVLPTDCFSPSSSCTPLGSQRFPLSIETTFASFSESLEP